VPIKKSSRLLTTKNTKRRGFRKKKNEKKTFWERRGAFPAAGGRGGEISTIPWEKWQHHHLLERKGEGVALEGGRKMAVQHLTTKRSPEGRGEEEEKKLLRERKRRTLMARQEEGNDRPHIIKGRHPDETAKIRGGAEGSLGIGEGGGGDSVSRERGKRLSNFFGTISTTKTEIGSWKESGPRESLIPPSKKRLRAPRRSKTEC